MNIFIFCTIVLVVTAIILYRYATASVREYRRLSVNLQFAKVSLDYMQNHIEQNHLSNHPNSPKVIKERQHAIAVAEKELQFFLMTHPDLTPA